MKIGLLSDTHGDLDPRIYHHFEKVDEIWHAGDIGTIQVTDELSQFKPVRAVYGNIDGHEIRVVHPLTQVFTIHNTRVGIIHIGGYPGRYARGVREWIERERLNLMICGHSHILKVMPDKKRGLIHMNPGAAGYKGFHKVRTLLRFDIEPTGLANLEVIELGLRSAKD